MILDHFTIDSKYGADLGILFGFLNHHVKTRLGDVLSNHSGQEYELRPSRRWNPHAVFALRDT